MSSQMSSSSMMSMDMPRSYGLVTGVVAVSFATTHLLMTLQVVQARRKCALSLAAASTSSCDVCGGFGSAPMANNSASASAPPLFHCVPTSRCNTACSWPPRLALANSGYEVHCCVAQSAQRQPRKCIALNLSRWNCFASHLFRWHNSCDMIRAAVSVDGQMRMASGATRMCKLLNTAPEPDQQHAPAQSHSPKLLTIMPGTLQVFVQGRRACAGRLRHKRQLRR